MSCGRAGDLGWSRTMLPSVSPKRLAELLGYAYAELPRVNPAIGTDRAGTRIVPDETLVLRDADRLGAFPRRSVRRRQAAAFVATKAISHGVKRRPKRACRRGYRTPSLL